MKNTYTGLFALLISINVSNVSGDIVKDISRPMDGPDTGNGGYFELGIGVEYRDDSRLFISEDEDKDQFTGIVSGAYRYNGVFIEFSQGTLDGINLGYTLWNNEQWALDVLGSSISGTFTSGSNDNNAISETEKNTALLDRDTLYNGAGLRLTGYFGNTIFQYRLVTDVHNGNGVVSNLRLGRSWQVKNWNFHSLVSTDYASAKTSHHWYGVSADEATSRFSEYDIDDTFSYTAEVGVTYPITEHWVFRSFARYTQFSKDVENSPLVDGDNSAYLSTSINYVF